MVRDFVASMGITYIKLAQILATQNYGKIFTEEDRRGLSSICDSCNPLDFGRVREILKREYGDQLEGIFETIDENPVGSASVSQVHRAKLVTGEEVVIKVKRQDVAMRVEKDITQIRKLMRRFAWIVRFKNLSAGDYGLDLYLEWIQQEVDFRHECENMRRYGEFIKSVNDKVHDTIRMHVPKLYERYCTNQIIVMEYVAAPTINQLVLDEQNKAKITTAINSFMSLSFYALLHGMQVAFHGDPHGGNICIGENGDMWFLDLGLLFVMDEEEAELCRQFFLAAYTNNADRIYQLLMPYGKMTKQEQWRFREDCQEYCDKLQQKEVSFYFVDMLNICLKYEFVPPRFLFGMAKAFLCLNGIGQLADNDIIAVELLQEQVMTFMLRRSWQDCSKVMQGAASVALGGVTSLPQGLAEAASKVLVESGKVKGDLMTLTDHFREILDLMA